MADQLVTSFLPTIYGKFTVTAFRSAFEDFPHLALYNCKWKSGDVVHVRIHSECMTGDVFSSVRCDCGEQLAASMKYLEDFGGVLIYLRQEGRGIGLVNKLTAYNLQDEGMDTIRANHALGFHADERNYSDAVDILTALNISKIHLLTNNPDKVDVFKDSRVQVVSRIPLEIDPRPENRQYLKTKKESMGHLFDDLDLQL